MFESRKFKQSNKHDTKKHDLKNTRKTSDQENLQT